MPAFKEDLKKSERYWALRRSRKYTPVSLESKHFLFLFLTFFFVLWVAFQHKRVFIKVLDFKSVNNWSQKITVLLCDKTFYRSFSERREVILSLKLRLPLFDVIVHFHISLQQQKTAATIYSDLPLIL